MTFEVAIPDTSLEDCSSLREKTEKVGLLARALAIFRVERVLVYKTPKAKDAIVRDGALLLKLLRFMDTPQYLRKQVFSHTPVLKFAGILPPLRMRSHPLAAKTSDLREGDIRWGIQDRKGSVDLGLDRPIKFDGPVDKHQPTLFRVKSAKQAINLEIIEREDVDYYFGFDVESVDDFLSTLNQYDAYTKTAFSRNGVQFAKVVDDVESVLKTNGSILALFGSPKKGVSDIFRDSVAELKSHIDFWINTISDQGTETVRLEEAVFTSLSLLNDNLGTLYAKPGYYNV
jgi:predicted SPOUT superfamily RNA methylase MTH1